MTTNTGTWKDSAANVAGNSLSRCTHQTLNELFNDVLQARQFQATSGNCWNCTLSGARPRKFVTVTQINYEEKYWNNLSLLQESARNQDNAKFWSSVVEAQSTQRINHGILVYHLAAYVKNGLPPANCNASHLCGNPLCINPDHLCWEGMQYNATRNCCSYMAKHNPKFEVKVHCLHEPKCVV